MNFSFGQIRTGQNPRGNTGAHPAIALSTSTREKQAWRYFSEQAHLVFPSAAQFFR